MSSPNSHIHSKFSNKQHNGNDIASTVNVAIYATYKSDQEAINDVCHYIENNLSDITQLPELFFVGDKTLLNDFAQREAVEYLSKQFISQISNVLRDYQFVCTSLILDGDHQAVIINHQGIVARQRQVDSCQRYPWARLDSNIEITTLSLEQGNINVAMLTGDDLHQGNNFSSLFLPKEDNSIQVMLIPFDIQSEAEVIALKLKADEYKVCLLAASREKSFKSQLQATTREGIINTSSITDNSVQSSNNKTTNIFAKNKQKETKTTGFIANIRLSENMLANWHLPAQNTLSSTAMIKDQYGKITKAVIHPIATIG